MLRGFYTSANGIINEDRILQVISNNLANVKTAGYKSDTAVPTTFAENMLLIRGRNSDTGTIRYRTVDETFTSLENGAITQTDSPLDVAILGTVFFNIESYSDGRTLLTKDGQFDIDENGDLELGNIGKVLDANGNYINVVTSDFLITPDGHIITGDGREYDLGLTYIEDGTDVEKVGDNLFSPYNGENMGNIPDDVDFTVKQGWYERSNVDIADEMVKAIDANNLFRANLQALQVMNGINQIAANDLMKRS